MPDFTDAELLQLYRHPDADLSLLTPDELKRVDTLTKAPDAPALVTQMGERPRGGYTASDSETGDHPIMDALSSAAHPKTYGDMLSLLIPSEASAVGPALVRGIRAVTDSTPFQVAKGMLGGAAKNIPGVSPIVRGALQGGRQALDTRAIAAVDNPANVQRAFRATTAQAAKRGVQLSPDDLTTTSAPADVRLPSPAEETGAPSGAVNVPGRAGSASYGPRGDLGAWVQQRIAEQSPASTPLTATVRPAADTLVNPLANQSGSLLTPKEQALVAELWKAQQDTRASQAIGRTYPSADFVPQGLEDQYPGQAPSAVRPVTTPSIGPGNLGGRQAIPPELLEQLRRDPVFGPLLKTP